MVISREIYVLFWIWNVKRIFGMPIFVFIQSNQNNWIKKIIELMESDAKIIALILKKDNEIDQGNSLLINFEKKRTTKKSSSC